MVAPPGLFGASHVPYEVDRTKDNLDTPTLKQMTLKAIEILQKQDEGFVLLVRTDERELFVHTLL